MIISRGIFGLGGENLSITTSAFIGQWFKGKELAFALGVDISAARLAATINDSTQVVMYNESGRRLHLGFFVGLLITIYAIITALIACIIDKRADKSEKGTAIEEDKNESEEVEEVHVSDILKFPLPYWYITFSCLFFYMGYFSFMNVVSELMQKRFAISGFNAGFLMVFGVVIGRVFLISLEH
jgi:nitrate/nitrite transporter NarK